MLTERHRQRRQRLKVKSNKQAGVAAAATVQVTVSQYTSTPPHRLKVTSMSSVVSEQALMKFLEEANQESKVESMRMLAERIYVRGGLKKYECSRCCRLDQDQAVCQAGHYSCSRCQRRRNPGGCWDCSKPFTRIVETEDEVWPVFLRKLREWRAQDVYQCRLCRRPEFYLDTIGMELPGPGYATAHCIIEHGCDPAGDHFRFNRLFDAIRF